MYDSLTDYVYDRNQDPLPLYYYPMIGRIYRKRVEMCLELLPGGDRVLEVGFGCGLCLPNLQILYKELHGIDLHSDCRAVAEAFSIQGISATLTNGSIVNLPYEDEYFDSVLLVSILEHLKKNELEYAFSEVKRVLKKDGTMVYGVPVERPFMVFAFSLLGYNIRKHHFSTESEISAMAAKYLRQEQRTLLNLLPGKVLSVYEVQRFTKR